MANLAKAIPRRLRCHYGVSLLFYKGNSTFFSCKRGINVEPAKGQMFNSLTDVAKHLQNLGVKVFVMFMVPCTICLPSDKLIRYSKSNKSMKRLYFRLTHQKTLKWQNFWVNMVCWMRRRAILILLKKNWCLQGWWVVEETHRRKKCPLLSLQTYVI